MEKRAGFVGVAAMHGCNPVGKERIVEDAWISLGDMSTIAFWWDLIALHMAYSIPWTAENSPGAETLHRSNNYLEDVNALRA